MGWIELGKEKWIHAVAYLWSGNEHRTMWIAAYCCSVVAFGFIYDLKILVLRTSKW